ncbi:hypothetical protein U1Q18_005779 [Sarracenia purpurea var. burkii]
MKTNELKRRRIHREFNPNAGALRGGGDDGGGTDPNAGDEQRRGPDLRSLRCGGEQRRGTAGLCVEGLGEDGAMALCVEGLREEGKIERRGRGRGGTRVCLWRV